ncbi:hypothetical protein V6Z12_D05G056600 [Gossypium hirsutum]
MPSRCEILCELLIAILIPPLGVCFRHGCCSVEFWICVLLTILGYVPGIIYALYAIVFVDRDEYFDEYSDFHQLGIGTESDNHLHYHPRLGILLLVFRKLWHV